MGLGVGDDDDDEEEEEEASGRRWGVKALCFRLRTKNIALCRGRYGYCVTSPQKRQ